MAGSPADRGDWSRIESFQVTEGVEMTFEEIGLVIGVSKQRVEQVYQVALRKSALRAAVARLREFA